MTDNNCVPHAKEPIMFRIHSIILPISILLKRSFSVFQFLLNSIKLNIFNFVKSLNIIISYSLFVI